MKKPFVRAVALSLTLFVLLAGVFFFASGSTTYAAGLDAPQNSNRMNGHRHHHGKKRTTISWRKRRYHHHKHHH